jgi:MFS family permease
VSGRGLVWRLARPLLVTACLAQLIVPVARLATSYRATELAMTPADILILSSAFSLLGVFLAVFMGRYNDMHGNGVAALAGACCLLLACIMLALPVAWGFWWLMAASAVLGLGQTLHVTAVQGEVGMFRLSRHRDGMIGGLMLWQAVGQLAAPLVLSLVALSGGTLSLRLSVVAALLSLMAVAFSVLLWRHGATPRDVQVAPAALLNILSTPSLGWVMLAGSLCVAVHDLTLVYMPVVGAERGIPAAEVGVLLALFAGGQMLARGAYRTAARLAGRRSLMLFGVLGTAAFTAGLALPVGSVMLGGLLGLTGACIGFAITASVSLTIDLAPARSRATSLGLRLSMNRIGQFLIPLAAGGAAAALGPGVVFVLLGSTLGGVGLYGARALATTRCA